MSDNERADPFYRTMHDLPDDDRPREKLLKQGPEALTNGELVAIVLRSGTRGHNAVDMARSVLDKVGGLSGLVRADAQSLRGIKGLGPVKRAELLAAIELGRRVHQLDPGDRPQLNSPEAVYAYMHPRFIGKTKEELHVLSLDTRGRLLGSVKVFEGSIQSVAARAADVYREPMVLEAVSIVLVHNHPSGDAQPSAQDVAVTRRLEEAGVLLEIKLLDHVIIGLNSWVSLQRDGFAFQKKRT